MTQDLKNANSSYKEFKMDEFKDSFIHKCQWNE